MAVRTRRSSGALALLVALTLTLTLTTVLVPAGLPWSGFSPAVTAHAATARSGGTYVALGDSFTAGPFIPWPTGRPAGCDRSDRNYPSLIQRRMRFARFTDVSCSGATTRHMTAPQKVEPYPNPPQLSALTATTTLVTLGIGGNDAGFGALSVDCALISITDLNGAPCRSLLGDQVERRIAATGPRITSILQAIHERAPRARVLVVGYLRLMPAGKGCWPMVPYARGDVPFLDQMQRLLNDMLRRHAVAGGAEFVDAYAPGIGHDMCAAPRAKWVEGVLLTNPAAPIHPNAAGMRAVAALVLGRLGGHADLAARPASG